MSVLEYQVHSVHETKVSVVAEVNKVAMTVEAPCLEVELVPVSGRHSTLTIRALGADFAAAKEMYVVDKKVTVTVAT